MAVSEDHGHGPGEKCGGAEAAARLLKERIDDVADLLVKARRIDDKDRKRVHQLRVATRRASAALAAFKPRLRRSLRRRLQRRLRRIRAAAAPVRQCDVHLTQIRELHGRAADHARPVLEFVVDRIASERDSARREVMDVARRYRRRGIRRLRRRLIDELDPSMPDSETVAAEVLARLGGRLSDAAAADLRLFENLHRLRIRAKKLRYAQELFAEHQAADPAARRLQARVMDMQDRLGQINDSFEMASRLERYLAEMSDPSQEPSKAADERRAALSELAALFRDELLSRRHQFLQWWQSVGPMTTSPAAAERSTPPRG